ncbi:MAG: hypothetical protein RMX68_026615 [Aulosira sp. ZfuVER01]|nr:hypothetical protein [Aulosira sp. ZfuVER01]MDZ8000125.1 hypothetical protein [Aulosira sp. DedVER01a]MDZ8055633.1 hypothetical protein [Aulosira sp. ZfuCHP01]
MGFKRKVGWTCLTEITDRGFSILRSQLPTMRRSLRYNPSKNILLAVLNAAISRKWTLMAPAIEQNSKTFS